MKREYIKTSDGSSTIYVPELDETYHSRHGAINEALHVFIKSGLLHFNSKSTKPESCVILEIGFGTGLNAFLTCLEGQKLNFKIQYEGVEAYPVLLEDLEHINFYTLVESGAHKALFYQLHQAEWEHYININEKFRLKKVENTFDKINSENQFDIVYYDAFGPRVQPELWEEAMFLSMYKALKPGGVLVTYCAQGKARRAMQSVGFSVERLEGPPGKREMLRATKPE